LNVWREIERYGIVMHLKSANLLPTYVELRVSTLAREYIRKKFVLVCMHESVDFTRWWNGKRFLFSHCCFFHITYIHRLYASNQLPVKRVRAKTFKYSLPKKITWFFLIWYVCVLLTLPSHTLGNISILPVHKIIIKAANGVY
jgi:hypothetical protein